MLKVKKSGFTLVEVILACSIFAIVVSWIILAINRSFAFMDNIKLTVRATNFVREWMEMMYNIRDTNWRKHSGEREKYWLNLGINTSSNFVPWIYVLKEKSETNQNPNKYLYAEHLSNNWSSNDIERFYSSDGFRDEDNVFSTARGKAKLTVDWKYSYYGWDDDNNKEKLIEDNSIEDALIWQWLEFYRIVRVFGVYEKNVDSSTTSISSSDVKLTNWTPAEMRFCVKVFYRSTWKHAAELCGIITNFKG